MNTVAHPVEEQLAAELARLGQSLSGDMLLPGSDRFGEARALWNGMVDRRPAAIVRPLDEVDIQRALELAQQNRLQVSVKGGGHNVAGNALVNDGLTIDLSRMNRVLVDTDRRRARVQGGALWQDVDAATAPYELATTGGVISSTGVGGLTLGGGIGWLVGKHGMAIDNLLSATVVTGTGEVVHASADSHPDLFWALRGGGGNFGVVTSFEFQLHPQPPVLAGYLAYPISEARDLLDFYRDFTATAPRELGLYYQLSTDPESGARLALLAFFWPNDHAVGAALLDEIREFKQPLVEEVGVMPYVAWQQAFDEEFPHGRRYYWKSSLKGSLDDEALDAIVAYGGEPELTQSSVTIEWYRGAMNDIGPDDTAFFQRSAQYQIVISAAWEDPHDDERGASWARDFHRAASAHEGATAFLNFDSTVSQESGSVAHRSIGKNLARLRDIKKLYDPDNLLIGNGTLM